MPNYQGPSGLSKQFLIYGGSDLVPISDFTDWIDWEKAELAMAASNGESTTSTLTIRDESGVIPDEIGNMFVRAHNVATLTVGSNTIWRGRVVGLKTFRGRQPAYRARELEVSFADYNSDLNGIVVHEWPRPAETDVQRAQALVAAYLSGSPRATTNLNGSNFISSSNTINLPAETYSQMTPGDVLVELTADSDKEMFVTVDGQLFYDGHDSQAYNSLLRISDADLEGDAVTYPPDKDASAERFLREQITALRSYYGPDQTDSVRVTSTRMAETDYWEDIWFDERAINSNRATVRAQRLLNYQDTISSSFTMTIGPMNGHEVWKIKAGQLIQFRDRGLRGGRTSAGAYVGDDWSTARIREVRWSFPGVDQYIAQVDLDRARFRGPPRNNPFVPQPVATAPQVCRSVNLLLGLTGSSLKVSSASTNYPKQKACDGDASSASHWSAAFDQGVDEEYWAADIGSAQNAEAYRIVQGLQHGVYSIDDAASEIKLYGSTSASAWTWLPSGKLTADPAANGWTLVATITPSGADTGTVSFTPVAYRYWLVRASVGPAPGVGTGWNVQEVEILDQDCATSDVSGGTSSSGGGSGTTSGNAAPAEHVHAHGYIAGAGPYHDVSGITGAQVQLDNWMSTGRFVVTANRGYNLADDGNSGTSEPEDTMEGFRLSAQAGADGVEADIQQNADGSWVVMHDTTVSRTTTSTGNVNSKTDAQWAALVIDGGFGYNASRHGSSYAPPFLTDVLDACNPYGVFYVLEVKGGDTADLADFLVEQNIIGRTLVVATVTQAQELKAANDAITTMVNYPEGEGETAADWLSGEYSEWTSLSVVNGVLPQVPHAYIDTDEMTIDESAIMQDMYDRGIRSFESYMITEAIDFRDGLAGGGEPTADAHIADTLDAHDASAISVVDTGGYFSGTDVEAALQELGAGSSDCIWEPLTNGSTSSPELIFLDGDVVMVEVCA